jgi:hypothetical protein
MSLNLILEYFTPKLVELSQLYEFIILPGAYVLQLNRAAKKLTRKHLVADCRNIVFPH